MKKLLFAAACVVLTFSGVAYANVGICEELWVERNSYYKEAGYCFQMPRAIQYFGNGGCRFANQEAIYLPRMIRDRIAQIMWAERNLACM
jgi:YARHG domain